MHVQVSVPHHITYGRSVFTSRSDKNRRPTLAPPHSCSPNKGICEHVCARALNVSPLAHGAQTPQVLSGHTDWVRDVAWAPSIASTISTIATASQVRLDLCDALRLLLVCRGYGAELSQETQYAHSIFGSRTDRFLSGRRTAPSRRNGYVVVCLLCNVIASVHSSA